jgi:protein-tyrosine-phosphatase
MAEAILRHLSHGAVDVASAGTLPKPDIHPMARQAIRTQFGLEMTGQFPKSVGRFIDQPFDYVITLCDDAAETCPLFPGVSERIHWMLQDPAAVIGTDEEKQRAFDDVARQLLARMRVWLSLAPLRNRIDSHQTERAQ